MAGPSAPLVLLSFVDHSRSEPRGCTTYRWGDETCAGEDLLTALVRFFGPDRVVLFGGGDGYPPASVDGTQVRWQPIPEGGALESDLWTVFSQLCDAVNAGDRVIVEISNGTSLLSFITFVAVQYLRETKGVQIERVCSIAPGGDGAALVQDLSGILTVLDWARGVHDFTQHVDAADLGALMGSAQNSAYRSGIGHPMSLKPWGHALSLFTQAVRLSRPREVMQAADLLTAHLTEVTAEVRQMVPPLAPMMDQLQEVTAMGHGGSPDLLTWEALSISLNLIAYQCRHDLIMQAVTLAREWCLNYLILELDYHPDQWLSWEVREEIGRTITGAALEVRHHPYEGTSLSARFACLDQKDDLVTLWIILSDLRNDLAHCGMNLQQKSAVAIQGRTRDMVELLRELVAGSSCRVMGGRSGDDRSPELPPGESERGDGEDDKHEERDQDAHRCVDEVQPDRREVVADRKVSDPVDHMGQRIDR
jgi:hypothetical protein